MATDLTADKTICSGDQNHRRKANIARDTVEGFSILEKGSKHLATDRPSFNSHRF